MIIRIWYLINWVEHAKGCEGCGNENAKHSLLIVQWRRKHTCFAISPWNFKNIAKLTQLRKMAIKAEKMQNFQFWSLQFVRIYTFYPVSQMGVCLAYLAVFGVPGHCRIFEIDNFYPFLRNFVKGSPSTKLKIEDLLDFRDWSTNFMPHVKGEFWHEKFWIFFNFYCHFARLG